jgi:hypothetical protein
MTSIPASSPEHERVKHEDKKAKDSRGGWQADKNTITFLRTANSTIKNSSRPGFSSSHETLKR